MQELGGSRGKIRGDKGTEIGDKGGDR